MAKSRIKRGNRVYVYERENYRDGSGKVKHRNNRYMGVEVTENGITRIISPKKRFMDFEVVESVRYGDISVLYSIFDRYGIVDLLDGLVPRRGLPVGAVFVSLAINHIVDRETLHMFSKWYQDTALEDFTKIPVKKMNSSNLCMVMKTFSKLGVEGLVDVCSKLFDNVKHLESGSTSLFYDITSTYFYARKLPKARRGHNKDENSLPQVNISLAATKNKGLPIFFRTYEGNITDVNTIHQLIIDVKRIHLDVDVIILDRGMSSKKNLLDLAGSHLKIICGIPLTSNDAKMLVECPISEEHEMVRSSGLVYYEDVSTSLFGIHGRGIVCFNHSDLERDRSTRLKKIMVAEKAIEKLLHSKDICDKSSDYVESEIQTIILGVSDYFIVKNMNGNVAVTPNLENRRKARLRDGKCLIFTTDFKKDASDIISLYFGKDVIEKIFHCIKNWLDLQPVRHFDEGIVDVYVFICYLAYLGLALYKHHLGVVGWEGVHESLNELGRIKKATLTFGDTKIDKITVLTKEQKDIFKKLGFKDKLIHGL